MFTMVVLGIGIIEFILGVMFNIFAKSEKIHFYLSFLYEGISGKSKEIIIRTNRWIGENCSLTGSLYVFAASITRYLELDNIVLILLIGAVEIFSFKRTNSGINKIINDSQ